MRIRDARRFCHHRGTPVRIESTPVTSLIVKMIRVARHLLLTIAPYDFLLRVKLSHLVWMGVLGLVRGLCRMEMVDVKIGVGIAVLGRS